MELKFQTKEIGPFPSEPRKTVTLGIIDPTILKSAVKAILEVLFEKYGPRFPLDDESRMPHARMIIPGLESDPLGLESRLISPAVQTAEWLNGPGGARG